jgi:tRNA A-37 threonylcarbamoyl transferase component Bud32
MLIGLRLSKLAKNFMNKEINQLRQGERTRREFIKLAVATSVAVGAGPVWAADVKNDMIYRTLGSSPVGNYTTTCASIPSPYLGQANSLQTIEYEHTNGW